MNSIITSFVLFASTQAFAMSPIIGGTQVSSSDFISHTVVALVATSEAGQALCTASLVAQDLAVTAAHCVKDESRAPRARIDLLFGSDIHAPVAIRSVDRAEVPSEWDPASSSNANTSDVALIHFTGGLPAGFTASELLPFDRDLQSGQSVVLAGYGITSAVQNDGEGVLRKTTVTVMNGNYSSSEVELDQSHGGGACHGDSGGPAYVMVNQRPLLFGITSRGGGECDQDVIYTKIGAYGDWFKRAATAIRK